MQELLQSTRISIICGTLILATITSCTEDIESLPSQGINMNSNTEDVEIIETGHRMAYLEVTFNGYKFNNQKNGLQDNSVIISQLSSDDIEYLKSVRVLSDDKLLDGWGTEFLIWVNYETKVMAIASLGQNLKWDSNTLDDLVSWSYLDRKPRRPVLNKDRFELTR